MYNMEKKERVKIYIYNGCVGVIIVALIMIVWFQTHKIGALQQYIHLLQQLPVTYFK